MRIYSPRRKRPEITSAAIPNTVWALLWRVPRDRISRVLVLAIAIAALDTPSAVASVIAVPPIKRRKGPLYRMLTFTLTPGLRAFRAWLATREAALSPFATAALSRHLDAAIVLANTATKPDLLEIDSLLLARYAPPQ